MKNRLICTAFTVLLSFTAACTQAEIKSTGKDIGEVVIITENDSASVPDKIEIENDTENGENDIINEESEELIVKEDSDSNLTSSEESDSQNTENSFTEEIKPSIEDYSITDMFGEYVCIKSSVVRSGPSTDFDKLGQLKCDEVVNITGMSDNGWYRFEFEDSTGFANRKFFEDKESYDEEILAEEDTDEIFSLNEDEDKSDEDFSDVSFEESTLIIAE